MKIDIDELRKLAEAATPGPWDHCEKTYDGMPLVVADGYGFPAEPVSKGAFVAGDHDDAAFIAAANPATVLALVDELDAAREAIDIYAALQEDARRTLQCFSDRMDEFIYDEFSAALNDGPFDEHDEEYRSQLALARARVNELQRTRPARLEPGRWWRVLDPDGELWCETSSESEARAAMRPGDRLQRQWYGEVRQWKDAE